MKDLNQKWGIYTPLRHWVGRGTGTPKDKDEVNRQEVCECEGWVWDLDAIGAPSRLRLIRKTAALERIFSTLDLSIEEKESGGSGRIHDLIALTELLKLQKSGQFPDEPVRIKFGSLIGLVTVCLLWINKAKAIDKMYMWVPVLWKTTN